MAAACLTSLATQTTVATSQSFSTFTSTVVSTLSPGVTTITSTHPCSAGGGGGGASASAAACSPVVTTVTSTIPGGTTTLTTIGTSTIDVLSTQTTTFLNSSCGSSTLSTSSSLPSEASTTTSVVIVTNPNNGQVSTQYIVSTVLPASLQTNQPKTTSGTGKNVGGIVGGVFGGLAGLGLLVLGGLWFIRRRKRWDMIFDSDDNKAWNAPGTGPGVNNDPYAYGPVGVGGRTDRLEVDDSGQGRRMVLD